jgi:hypothetical protein
MVSGLDFKDAKEARRHKIISIPLFFIIKEPQIDIKSFEKCEKQKEIAG